MELKPWSFTSLTSFETCPKKYYHTRVAKDVTEPQGEAALWGDWVHKQFQASLETGVALPDKIKKWQGLVDKAAAKPGEQFVEYKMAVSPSFQPADWWTSWSRGIVDFAVVNGDTALLLDWKTGNRKPGSDQLFLFAGYAFAHFPEVQKVTTGFVWLKDNKLDKDTFTREHIPVIWADFTVRARRLELAYEEEKWPAKPSGLCKEWCWVGKQRCVFCGRA